MKILFFSKDYTTHDHRFLSNLAASKHKIYFLRLEMATSQFETRPLPEGVEEIDWPSGHTPPKTIDSLLSLMNKYESILHQVKPDLVHAGPVQSCGFMTALADFNPFFVMSWGSDILVDSERNDTYHWITRHTLNRSDALVCDCQAVTDKVIDMGNYADKPIVQFPWGVDLQIFSPALSSTSLREQLNWQDTFILISTRSWEPLYGIDTLLDAFRMALSQIPRLRLLLLGDGSLAPSIQKYIDAHHLEDSVHRPGRITYDLLPNYYRCSDLYVSCSSSDGTSVSLLEAMATGLPVLVTDIPGNREWVQQGENGWLSPVGDVERLTQLITEAASMRESEHKTLSVQNRRLAELRANWDINFNTLLQAYDRIETEYYH